MNTKTYPQRYPGSLDLSGCGLAGVALPQHVGGSLDLSGCDLAGVTLPQHVGRSLDLRGCWNNPWPLLASADEYELYAVPVAGTRYIAGCRNFSRAEALAHWAERTDPRAVLFRKAILEHAA